MWKGLTEMAALGSGAGERRQLVGAILIRVPALVNHKGLCLEASFDTY